MTWLRQYLLGIVCAAVLCGILRSLIGKNIASSALLKMLSGLFLTITVIAPWTQLEFSDMKDYFAEISVDADIAVAAGQAYAQEEAEAIIKSQSEAYILDIAKSLELDIQAEVSLNRNTMPLPEAVVLTGNTSPYSKARLTQIIEEELGIPEDRQIWQ